MLKLLSQSGEGTKSVSINQIIINYHMADPGKMTAKQLVECRAYQMKKTMPNHVDALNQQTRLLQGGIMETQSDQVARLL